MRFILNSCIAVAFLTGGTALAEETESHSFYRAWLEAGALFPQDTELHSFPGSSGSSEVNLNPRLRLSAGADYSFAQWFSAGWEIGVLASSIDRASGLSEIDAMITQVPFLANAIVRYENESQFVPFVGIGLGGASTAINVDEARSSTVVVEGSDYDFVFAWQLAGGVKYQFRNGLETGLVYKYLWTADSEWELENEGLSGGDTHLELDGIRSHALLAYVSFRF